MRIKSILKTAQPKKQQQSKNNNNNQRNNNNNQRNNNNHVFQFFENVPMMKNFRKIINDGQIGGIKFEALAEES